MFVSVANERKKRKGREVFSGDFLKGKLRIHKSTWFWIKLERRMRNFFALFFGYHYSLWKSQLTPSSVSATEWKIQCCQSFQESHHTLLSSSYFFFNIIGITIIITLIFTEGLLCARPWDDAVYALAVLTLTAALWTRHPLFLHEKSSYGAFTCSTN